jgi:hypothetical protein
LLALMSIATTAHATTFTTSQSVIDCPTGGSIAGIGRYGNGDGSMYEIGTYLGGETMYGTPQHIYRQYIDSNGTPGTCYDSDPQSYLVYYYGWVRDLSWGQTGSSPYWNGALIWFSTFDGNLFETTDGGYTWSDGACSSSAYCDAGPSTSTSCFYTTTGSPLTCPAGQYCFDGGFDTYIHKEIGECVTGCTQTVNQGGCSCQLTLDVDPNSGVCPGNYLLTTAGNCVLPNDDSTCTN